MRRLTLILSDLYLPEEASHAGAVTAPLALPGLTSLLRTATRIPVWPDWRRWLMSELGLGDLSAVPVAHLAARAVSPAAEASTAWLATPVHLEVRLDHVRLVDRGLLTVSDAERQEMCAQFARQFGPQYGLLATGGRDFVLTGTSASRALTHDPARLLDADVATALPRSSDAVELRKLGAEIEMWLHGLAINDARERAGLRRVTGLWLWGGGAPVAMPERAANLQPLVVMHGSDAFLAGLARFVNLPPLAPAPRGLTAVENHHIVELTPMSGDSRHSLAFVEEHWFEPARSALESGAMNQLDIVANDTCFRVTPWMRWRYWRPRRNWFENVARRPETRQA